MDSEGINEISGIKISEFVPNPEGSDTTEFIELFNSSGEEIDLSGLKLDDEEGGSRGYTIPDGVVILPGEYLVFGKQETRIALNNSSDSVRLLYPNGDVIYDIGYDNVTEGAAFVQDDDDVWVWTGEITPGEENVVEVIEKKTKTTRK